MPIGKTLLTLRKSNHYTQNQIADRLGISKVTYFRYENDMRSPSHAVIEKLAEIYNVPADYILGIETKTSDDEMQSLMELREELRRSPATRLLFSLTKNATEEDILKVAKTLEVWKNDDNSD